MTGAVAGVACVYEREWAFQNRLKKTSSRKVLGIARCDGKIVQQLYKNQLRTQISSPKMLFTQSFYFVLGTAAAAAAQVPAPAAVPAPPS